MVCMHTYTHITVESICLSVVVEGRICPTNTVPFFLKTRSYLVSQDGVGLAMEPRPLPESQLSLCLNFPSTKVSSISYPIQCHWIFLTLPVNTWKCFPITFICVHMKFILSEILFCIFAEILLHNDGLILQCLVNWEANFSEFLFNRLYFWYYFV